MSSEDLLNRSTPDGDFTPLSSRDEYQAYFEQLHRVLGYLTDCYPENNDPKAREERLTRSLLQKLRYTMKALEKKYLFRAEGERPLWVDVTESGFPNHLELAELEVDLARKENCLRELAPASILKRTLVDDLFRLGEEPVEVLRQLSKRTYFEKLEEECLFRQFTEGSLVRLAEADGIRRYLYTFGCYDFHTNRPYLNFLTFDQDIESQRLELFGSNYEEFMNTIRSEGSRAPDVGLLAMSIDEALETIHPKALKRVCVGPLYSKVLLKDRTPNRADPREEYMQHLLLSYGRKDDDFVLLLTEEVVFSKRQEISRGVFSPQGKVREVFAITESDQETLSRKASAVNHYFLLPHELLQHVEPQTGIRIADFTKARKLTVDDMGQIHGL